MYVELTELSMGACCFVFCSTINSSFVEGFIAAILLVSDVLHVVVDVDASDVVIINGMYSSVRSFLLFDGPV